MGAYRRIFVAIDSGHVASAAVRRGAQLAQRCGADLAIVLFDHDPAVERAARGGSGPREIFVVERRQWLRALVRPLIDPALRVRVEAVWAPQRRDAILAAVLAEKPDLVIKDIGHESLLKRLIATPLDWQLLRTVPAPLMLVQPHATQLPRRVLASVGADGDHAKALDDRILAEAQRIAGCCEARVDLVHAFPCGPAHEGSFEGVDAELADEDREAFAQLASRHDIPLEHRYWIAGEAQHAVHRLAALKHADLIVLGSAYRSTFERFALGTTAEALIAHAAADVLLVKPAAFVEELARHVDLEDLQRRYLAAA